LRIGTVPHTRTSRPPDRRHCFVTFDGENRVMEPAKEIKPIDGTAVRCEADRCEKPALFLFVAARASAGRWAYCEKHAELRARQEKLELPMEMAAASGAR